MSDTTTPTPDPLRGSALVVFVKEHFFMCAELADDAARGRVLSAVVEGLQSGTVPKIADIAERVIAQDLILDAEANAKKWAGKSHPGKAGAPTGNDNAKKTRSGKADAEQPSEPDAEHTQTHAPAPAKTDFVPTLPIATAFDSFWAAWPRKVARKAAEKAFASAWKKGTITTDNLPAIIEAVQSNAASAQWREADGKYIPHPATWLNGERWLDAAGPSASPSAPTVYFNGGDDE